MLDTGCYGLFTKEVRFWLSSLIMLNSRVAQAFDTASPTQPNGFCPGSKHRILRSPTWKVALQAGSIDMVYKGFFVTLLLIFAVLLTVGCGSRFSSLFSESWSENHALAVYDAEASHLEINDGDVMTWGATRPPNREYTITLPEERQIHRIVIYSGNVLAYQLLCWDKKADKWKVVGAVGTTKGRQKVYADRHRLDIPRFDHRINFKTDKIKLQVKRAESDGIVTTRTPSKNDAILNHRVEYIGTGRRRMRVDLYDIFVYGLARIREIEVYSHLEKPEIE